jgi:hypothetical protein
MADCCEHENEPTDLTKSGDGRLLAAQEGLVQYTKLVLL